MAEALGLALGAGEQERLGERPTENLAAYDAFLSGEEAADGLPGLDQAAPRRGRDYYERAVALDSSFALAWAQLSRATRSSTGTPDHSAAAMAAQRAAERSLALAPKVPRVSGAWQLLRMVRYDAPRAARAVHDRARQLAPKDARLPGLVGWARVAPRAG